MFLMGPYNAYVAYEKSQFTVVQLAAWLAAFTVAVAGQMDC